jgi:2-dehydropantoate 2-reductase
VSSPPPDVVLGQGALGTLMATAVAGSRDVHVVSGRVDEPETVTLSAEGRGWDRQAQVQLTPKPPDRARLAVVATRTDEALQRARSIEAIVDEEGAIVPVQNGLASLAIADELGHDRVVPAIVGFNARLETPRSVHVTSPGEIAVGTLDEAARAGLAAFAGAVERPLGIHPTTNVAGAVWGKWCVSCAINGLAVVAGTGVGGITRRREGREALIGVLTECTEVAEAEDVDLERVAGPLAPDTLAGNATSGLGGAFRRGLVWLIGRRYQAVRPSSLEAFEGGRDPELGALNASAVERGEAAGVPTPWNRATLAIGRQIVDGGREPAMANLAEVRQRATR